MKCLAIELESGSFDNMQQELGFLNTFNYLVAYATYFLFKFSLYDVILYAM